jgi:hypothetical protein
VESKALPPVVEFLIDVTGSMNQDAYPNDPAKNASKWQEIKQVLPAAIQTLPSNWAIGVSFFGLDVVGSAVPQCYVGRQAVPIAPLDATQLGAITTAINAVVPVGATPTMAAWQFAFTELQAWPAPDAYANSSRFIVLITDGIPTITNDGCWQGQGSSSNGADAIAEAEYNAMITSIGSQGTAAKIKTFVIGVLGSENPQGAAYDPLFKLTQVAVAGNTATTGCTPAPGAPSGVTVSPRGNYCHFDMTANPDFAAGLSAALNQFSTSVLPCSFVVPPAPPRKLYDPYQTQVKYTPGATGIEWELNKASSSACTDGQWYVAATDPVSQAPTEIDLCSNTCDTVSRDSGAKVKVTLVCIEQM